MDRGSLVLYLAEDDESNSVASLEQAYWIMVCICQEQSHIVGI